MKPQIVTPSCASSANVAAALQSNASVATDGNYSSIWTSSEAMPIQSSLLRQQWYPTFPIRHRSIKYNVQKSLMGNTAVAKVGLDDHVTIKFAAQINLPALFHKSLVSQTTNLCTSGVSNSSDANAPASESKKKASSEKSGSEFYKDEDDDSDVSASQNSSSVDVGSNVSCDKEPWVAYSNTIGRVCITEARLKYGNKVISVYRPLSSEFDSYKDGSNKYNDEMLGRESNFDTLVENSSKDKMLLVDLDFPFTKHLQNGLYHNLLGPDLTVEMDIAKLEDFYISSDNSVPYIVDGDQQFSSKDIDITLFSEVIHVGSDEKDFILKNAHDGKQNSLRYLIPEFQYIVEEVGNKSICTQEADTSLVPDMSKSRQKATMQYFKVSVQAPVRDCTWVIQRDTEIDDNNYYNFCGLRGEDPISAYEWKESNKVLISERDSRHARLLDPWFWNNKKTPPKHVYSTTWDFNPLSSKPTAFIRMKNSELGLKFQKGLPSSKLHLFIRTWQVMELTAFQDKNNSTINMLL